MEQMCALLKHARALRSAKSEDYGAGGRRAQMAKRQGGGQCVVRGAGRGVWRAEDDREVHLPGNCPGERGRTVGMIAGGAGADIHLSWARAQGGGLGAGMQGFEFPSRTS